MRSRDFSRYLMRSALIGGLGLTGFANASIPNISYIDNKCTGSFVSGAFKKVAGSTTIVDFQGGLNTPLLQANYKYVCADGNTYTEYIEKSANTINSQLNYAPVSQFEVQPSFTYDQTSNKFTFSGKWNSVSSFPITVADPFILQLQYNYVNRLGYSQTASNNIQVWNTEQEARNGLALIPKYVSGNHTIEMLLGRIYPAFPFTNNKTDNPAGNTPRPFMRISYTGPTGMLAPDGKAPKYFATVYCFPGQGDNDFFNRPAIVADAFDPLNKRSASKIFSDRRFEALLTTYDGGRAEARKGTFSPRAQGYDMFFLDFSQGGGNLLINGSIFLKFVEWMHAKTPQTMVVGGPSMGGQIPRISLLYSMPENNLSNGAGVVGKDLATRVKGYLSIDSPHQGASIAGSVQWAMWEISKNSAVNKMTGFADYFGDYENSAIEQWQQLRTPAAHQMLFEHFYPGTGVTIPTIHNEFHDFLKKMGGAGGLGDARGYRKDIPNVAIAYSNFHKPVAGLSPNPYRTTAEIRIPGVFTTYKWVVGAGGAPGSPDWRTPGSASWQEFAPGSSGDWYYKNYDKKGVTFMFPVASAGETFMGTFIPLASALDLSGFDVMNPPTKSEFELLKYSPFDAVFYMRDEFNSYVSFKDPSKPNTTAANDRRYQHLMFDQQLMTSVMAGLKVIEEKYQRKVTSLPSYDGGYAQVSLTGGRNWSTVARAYPEFNWGTGQVSGFRVNNIAGGMLFPNLAADGKAKLIEGDFNGDLIPDLLLAQGHKWSSRPIALSQGYDALTFNLVTENLRITEASKLNIADFNADGKDDICVLGNAGDESIVVGLSRGDGNFDHWNGTQPAFTSWARQPEVKTVTGDFNGDGFPDIALVGGNGWTQVHMAMGKGDGTFNIQSFSAVNFARLAARKGAIIIAGGFRSNSQKGIAVLADNVIMTVYISGASMFETQMGFISPEGYPFWSYAADPKTTIVAADYNGDGRTDLAIVGRSDFNAIPMAFSKGDGTFTLTRKYQNDFPAWATTKGARVYAMDVNQDMRADLMMTGGEGWATMPVAISNGDGTFQVNNPAVVNFPGWAQNGGNKKPYHMARARDR